MGDILGSKIYCKGGIFHGQDFVIIRINIMGHIIFIYIYIYIFANVKFPTLQS